MVLTITLGVDNGFPTYPISTYHANRSVTCAHNVHKARSDSVSGSIDVDGNGPATTLASTTVLATTMMWLVTRTLAQKEKNATTWIPIHP